MRDLVESIVRNLVDHEGQVVVRQIEDSGSSIIEVKVEVGDVGKIIGKNGNTARSIRTLLKAVGKKNNLRYTLNIISDDKVQ